ncbi:unnamed protein product [Heterobilharzia americana]|nr:unnamed protein product [Heterobilharzia americana]
MSSLTEQFCDLAAAEELEVISAIYADEFSILEPESRVYEIKIRPDIENISKEEHIILKFQHINGYPSTKPLKYEFVLWY